MSDLKQLNVRIPPRTLAQLQALADAGHGTLTQVVIKAVDRLAQHELKETRAMQTIGEQLRTILATLAEREWIYTRPLNANDDVPADSAYSEAIRWCRLASARNTDGVARYEARFSSVALLERLTSGPLAPAAQAHYKALLSVVRLLQALTAYWLNAVPDAEAVGMAQAALRLSDEALAEVVTVNSTAGPVS